MTSRQLKLRHTQGKEGLVDRLTKVVRDAAGELLANALEDSPTAGGASASGVSGEPSRLRSFSSPSG